MTGTAVAQKFDYRPLGRMDEEQREKLINGALAMLAEDETVVNVAKHYQISKATLLAALTEYAEGEWKSLQVARAQVAVQRAAQKRMELALQLDDFQALEKAGEKTTETHMTYPRIREQLRIAEHEEKSAQWHLERLHKRIYGNSVAMTIDPKPFGSDFDASAMFESAMKAVRERAQEPPLSDAEKQAIVKFANEHPEVWDAATINRLMKVGAQNIGGRWCMPAKPIDATAEVVNVEITLQPEVPPDE